MDHESLFDAHVRDLIKNDGTTACPKSLLSRVPLIDYATVQKYSVLAYEEIA